MGTVVNFGELQEERLSRQRAKELDAARHKWTFLGVNDYEDAAIGAAQAEFYRLWFAAADRQGYFEAKPSPKEQSETQLAFYQEQERQRLLKAEKLK